MIVSEKYQDAIASGTLVARQRHQLWQAAEAVKATRLAQSRLGARRAAIPNRLRFLGDVGDGGPYRRVPSATCWLCGPHKLIISGNSSNRAER